MGLADAADQDLRQPRQGFGDISVELDAIEPGQLRALMQATIEQHLPADQYEILKAAEASERRLIAGLVGVMKGRSS